MKILAIETSCDETALAVLEATETESGTRFEILADPLVSQIELHREYGGVHPSLAKREHAKNIIPLLEKALTDASLSMEDTLQYDFSQTDELFEREPELYVAFKAFISSHNVPEIDAIAVTHGPGLPPALWLGVNVARALALLWRKPLVGVNHMEGHLLAGLATIEAETITLLNPPFPVLALLISGGHTELVLMRDWFTYELLGVTKDDAVGEAFDKVARMLELPYPGGPEISRLAEEARHADMTPAFSFPRPMMHENHFNFSFSGLKTSVMYFIKKLPDMNPLLAREIALEFENAVTDVLWKKTARAIEASGARTLVIGGGVSANKHIRGVFSQQIEEVFPDVSFRIPGARLTTDNALMIALAGYFRLKAGLLSDPKTLRAESNLPLAQNETGRA